MRIGKIYHYDQSSVPGSPANGQVWFERDGSGYLVGRWERRGSLWLSVTRYVSTYVKQSGSTENVTISEAIAAPVTNQGVWAERCIFNAYCTGTPDSSNYFTFQVAADRYNGNGIVLATFDTRNVSQTVADTPILHTPVTVNQQIPAVNCQTTQYYITEVGTGAGSLRWMSQVVYREIRGT